MRLTPPWDAYMSRPQLNSISMRQLHALAESADADLRGFFPDATSLAFLTMVLDRLEELNWCRPAAVRCVCIWCLTPFPDPDPYEV